jgi:hypothetical protein
MSHTGRLKAATAPWVFSIQRAEAPTSVQDVTADAPPSPVGGYRAANA